MYKNTMFFKYFVEKMLKFTENAWNCIYFHTVCIFLHRCSISFYFFVYICYGVGVCVVVVGGVVIVCGVVVVVVVVVGVVVVVVVVVV